MIGIVHLYGDELTLEVIPWFPTVDAAEEYAIHRIQTDPMMDDDDTLVVIRETDDDTEVIKIIRKGGETCITGSGSISPPSRLGDGCENPTRG